MQTSVTQTIARHFDARKHPKYNVIALLSSCCNQHRLHDAGPSFVWKPSPMLDRARASTGGHLLRHSRHNGHRDHPVYLHMSMHKGMRRRSNSETRNAGLGKASSTCVRKTAKTLAECGPACDSGSTRYTCATFAKCICSGRSSTAWVTLRFRPHKWSLGSSPSMDEMPHDLNISPVSTPSGAPPPK